MWSPIAAHGRDPDAHRRELSLITPRTPRDVLNMTAIEPIPSPFVSSMPLPRIVAAERLDQLEVQIADLGLRPADVEVVDRLAVELAVVHDDVAVGLEDLPRPPAERLVVGAHPRLEVAHDDRDLGDAVVEAGGLLGRRGAPGVG